MAKRKMIWDDRKGKVRPRRKKAMTEYDLYQDNTRRFEEKLGRKLKDKEYWKMLDDEEGGKGTYYTPNKKKKKPVKGILEEQGY